MRLNIRIVAKDSKTIIAALSSLLADKRFSRESNMYQEVFPPGGIAQVDYEYTDCNDVYEDDSKVKVISPVS